MCMSLFWYVQNIVYIWNKIYVSFFIGNDVLNALEKFLIVK